MKTATYLDAAALLYNLSHVPLLRTKYLLPDQNNKSSISQGMRHAHAQHRGLLHAQQHVLVTECNTSVLEVVGPETMSSQNHKGLLLNSPA